MYSEIENYINVIWMQIWIKRFSPNTEIVCNISSNWHDEQVTCESGCKDNDVVLTTRTQDSSS